MQTLYASAQDQSLQLDDAQKMYKVSIEKSFRLYLFGLHVFTKLCAKAVEDQKARKEKYLPTNEDKAFSSILHDNESVTSLRKNEYLQIQAKRHQFDSRYDSDLIGRLYKEFAKTKEYISYATKKDWDEQEHITILHDFLRMLKNHDTFNEMMEDAYINWIDDKSLVIGSVKRTFKALPIEGNYFEIHYPDEDAVRDFGEQLFIKSETHSTELEDIIKPVLENWDLERLAMVDIIALKMAIAELLYFPSIPTKVTLNEYVEMVKTYSTDKSKEFINGILDRLLKQLNEEGRIQKKGRGLIDQ